MELKVGQIVYIEEQRGNHHFSYGNGKIIKITPRQIWVEADKDLIADPLKFRNTDSVVECEVGKTKSNYKFLMWLK